MTRLDTEAAALLETPFHWGGRACGVGLDCIGVLVKAAERCGVRLEDYQGYGARIDPDSIMHKLIPQLEQIPVDEAQPGDVLVFWIRCTDTPAHIGILTDGGKFIHSSATTKTCTTASLDRWRRYVYGAYRLKLASGVAT